MNFFEKIQIKSIKKRYIYYFLFAFCFLIFFYQLDLVKLYMYDEFHYVPAAKSWVQMNTALNLEHPPFAKYLIGFSIKLFGDNPLGWRMFNLVSGVLLIVVIFKISELLFSEMIDCMFVTILSIFNFWIFLFSRIATLDIYLILFFFASTYFYLKFKIQDKNKDYFLSAISIGLTISIKWSGVFLVFPFLILISISLYQKSLIKVISFWLMIIAVYYLSFIPFLFLSDSSKLSLFQILFTQPVLMYKLLNSVNGDHIYISSWFTWPLMIRPMWFCFNVNKSLHIFRGILVIGNPLIMFFGLISSFYLLLSWRKIQDELKVFLMSFFFSWLVWGIFQRKVSFIYYFFPNAVMYSFFIPAAIKFSSLYKKKKVIYFLFSLISVALFIHFYPLLIGEWVSIEHKNQWIWFRSWI